MSTTKQSYEPSIIAKYFNELRDEMLKLLYYGHRDMSQTCSWTGKRQQKLLAITVNHTANNGTTWQAGPAKGISFLI